MLKYTENNDICLVVCFYCRTLYTVFTKKTHSCVLLYCTVRSVLVYLPENFLDLYKIVKECLQ